ncbi:hypothetical protein B484DRAFT_439967, partial [Ochromonadaceae sp. CCMP2298]
TLVTVSDTTAAESTAANALVSVTVVGQADRDVNLTCTLAPGTAVVGTAQGEDYTDGTFAFHFAPTETGTRTRNILLTLDSMTELTETLSVTCVHGAAPVSNVTIVRGTATATITDDDATVVTVADTAAVESSGAANALVSVSMDNPADRNVTVRCTLSPGTATEGTGFGQDYTDAVYDITFVPGVTGPLTRGILLTGDLVAELTEALTVTCAETSGGVATVAAGGTATATITDDDVSLVTVLDTAARENVTANSLVSVSLGNVADRAVNLTCTLTAGTAAAPGDYVDAVFKLTYAPGENGIKSQDVTLVDDDVAEAAETFNVTCVETSGAVATVSDPVGVATIVPDDTSVITVLDTSTSEADFAANDVVSVVMTGANDRVVTVSCSLTPGTALASGAAPDYTDGSPYLFTYAVNETGLKTLPVALVNDAVRELAETLTVTCVETSGGVGVVADGVATATIVDDDQVTLSVTDTASTEPTAANGLVAIVLTGTSDRVINVTCWLVEASPLVAGSAAPPGDYANATFAFG